MFVFFRQAEKGQSKEVSTMRSTAVLSTKAGDKEEPTVDKQADDGGNVLEDPARAVNVWSWNFIYDGVYNSCCVLGVK